MKILFTCESVSLAHIGRPLILAKWARENGMEVHFACSEEGLKKANISASEFLFHPLPTIDSNLFYQRVNQGKFFYKVDELKKYVANEVAMIRRINPDLIVSDFRLTTSISSALTNKPLLNLSNSFWSPNYECPFPAPEEGIFKFLPHRTSEILFNLMRPLAFKFFGKELNQARKYFGLELKSDFCEHYTAGAFTAYLDLPEFVNIKSLPFNHFFLGPVIWSPKVENKSYKIKEKNNVYISMGSTGNNSLLQVAMQAALENQLNIIISGVSVDEKLKLQKEYPQIVANCIIEPLINAEEVLPYCSVTICQGGSGTVYQSVANGVPVLCLPKNPDQGLVSLAVSQRNIGRGISYRQVNRETISSMIKECLLNEIVHQSTKKMQGEIKDWNTRLHWVRFLDAFSANSKTTKIFA